ncbi:MAG: GH3 auxin-responsive promoter family protein [Proteobacteria bacterium]|nr:GH3 auxin-responsive promoter family protein [Pseudomonadota bacterium]MDA1057417.1 GH3 auxin-responsive promoter family protein [Pseudomonadota bacterium]
MPDATPLLRAFARYRLNRLASLDPVESQRATLRRLVWTARRTRFGRDHGFADIADIAAYQRRVPIRRYEDFWNAYWQDDFPRLTDVSWPGTIPYFAVTSGTTAGRSKYIPVSKAMLRSNSKASADLYSFHLRARPKSRILAGKSFMLGGSTRLVDEAPGVQSGDLSGIMAANVPRYARPRFFPPPELALLDDWEEKVTRLAKQSLVEDIRMIGGTPSWLLLFFERMESDAAGMTVGEVYPDLEMLVHGGVSFAPYRDRFRRLFAGTHAEFREVYPASEGFVAMADDVPEAGLRLSLDHGMFFEFVPVRELGNPSPTRHWIENVQVGVDYAVVVSTCAGLWSYLIGDTVTFVDRLHARITITGRTAQMLSAFGEHVIVSELDRAITQSAERTHCAVTDYAVGALVPEQGSAQGRHLMVVEFEPATAAPDLSHFAALFDGALQDDNDDYRAHRSGDYGLGPPTIMVGRPGMFAAWMKRRGKLGGQNKVPRIITDPALLEDLRAFADTYGK